MHGIGGKTRVAGVIGWPVEHSLSPAMQNAAIERMGLDWIYLAFPVEPGALAEALAGARALGLIGLNVTLPHKQAVIPFLDRIDPAAQVIGAVNTIHFTPEGSIGYNTDALGYVRTVQAEGDFSFMGTTVLQFGAGGVGRAMAAGALEAGAATLFLHNRSLARAEALAADLRPHYREARIEAVAAEAVAGCAARADLIANATSLGMHEGDPLPLPAEVLEPRHVVFDTIYIPSPTALLTAAQRAGARPVGGLGMLARQGARALRIWSRDATGTEPDEMLMLAVLRGRLGQSTLPLPRTDSA